MRRPSFPFLAIAAVLALLLPLEQAHCLWMGAMPRPTARVAAAAKMTPDHSCCRGGAAAQQQPVSAGCVCLQLPPVAVPQAVVIASPNPQPVAFALTAPPIGSIAEPRSVRTESRALDVGSPPLPWNAGAHGLRAPPAIA